MPAKQQGSEQAGKGPGDRQASTLPRSSAESGELNCKAGPNGKKVLTSAPDVTACPAEWNTAARGQDRAFPQSPLPESRRRLDSLRGSSAGHTAQTHPPDGGFWNTHGGSLPEEGVCFVHEEEEAAKGRGCVRGCARLPTTSALPASGTQARAALSSFRVPRRGTPSSRSGRGRGEHAEHPNVALT